MDVNPISSPFNDEPVEEKSLSAAPLPLVLCQIRWPQITELIDNIDQIARTFGSVLSSDYPLSEQHQEMQIQVSPLGVTQVPGETIYQWTSADGDWVISLSKLFLTLQSKKYTSRSDFSERLEKALAALSAIVAIPVIDRIGFRYINRITEASDLRQLPKLIRSEVLGGSVIDFGHGVQMLHTVTETLYSVGQSRLLVKSAKLPPGGTLDPTVPPVPGESWILDLDASAENRIFFDPSNAVAVARDLSATAYDFFRWAVTDDFLQHFGDDR
jgi:uncharacterized protein (TIGR04255 family)